MTPNRRLRCLPGLLALALLVQGCGGASDEQPDTPTDAGAAGEGNFAEGGCEVWGEDREVTIGGGATGGAYFIIGAELAEIINDELECVTATAASGTSAEFIRGELDIVLTIADNAYCAWSGDGCQGFQEGELYDYGYMGSGHASSFLYVVSEDSPAESFSDFASGDLMGVSAPTLVDFNRNLLDLYGAEEAEVEILQGYDQLLTALRQGQFDVVEMGTAHPATALLEAQESQELRAIYHEDDVLQEFLENNPFMEEGVIEADVYNFLDGDYPTFSRRMVILAHNDVEGALIYAVLEAMYDNVDRLARALAQGDQFTVEVAQNAMEQGTIQIPLQPGALAYFEEQGVEIPEDIPAVGTEPPGAGG